MKKTVDILVAVRDEEENIPIFINNLKSLNINDVELGVLFLEDGSKDNTVKILKEYSDKDKNINYISLHNPYGQYAALTFGMNFSDSDAIITMDVDGGHPVEIVGKMIEKFLQGYNVVQGRRNVYKRGKKYRALFSYIYFFLCFIITGVNMFRQNVMFRLLDRKAKSIFISNKFWWHIFKTNFKKKDNLKSTYVIYNAPERTAGKSKYNLIKLFKLSYKSFFSLISLKRFLFVNMLFLVLIIYLIFNSYIYIGILLIIVFVIEVLSFILVRKNYPIEKIKILQTSLSTLK